jgi:hypothetical protein
MADITYEVPPKRKSRVSRFPHGTPRDPEKLLEIARLRNIEKLQWRQIGPIIGISAQGACLLYNHWKELKWVM